MDGTQYCTSTQSTLCFPIPHIFIIPSRALGGIGSCSSVFRNFRSNRRLKFYTLTCPHFKDMDNTSLQTLSKKILEYNAGGW